jgi:hypothetical protein
VKGELIMNKAILIQADDWEGLFINGKLVKEGHTLNEGTSRVKYFNQISKKHNFNLDDLKEVWIDESDEEKLYDCGSFPNSLSELNGNYENISDEDEE